MGMLDTDPLSQSSSQNKHVVDLLQELIAHNDLKGAIFQPFLNDSMGRPYLNRGRDEDVRVNNDFHLEEFSEKNAGGGQL
jgi:hypothetical protein